MPRFHTEENVSSLQTRMSFVLIVVLVFILVVLVRLFYLQVIYGSRYQTLSEQISIREEELRARRGLILDRNGKVLADNRPYFEIDIIPQDLHDRERTLASLTDLIPISREEIDKKIASAHGEAPFLPVVLVEDAPFAWVAKIREYQSPDYDADSPFYLEGVEVRASPLRVYLYPELFSHALGYLKEVDQKGLEKYDALNPGRYSSGDLMGASGVEHAYDLELRGEDGMKARVVDARGKEIRGSSETDTLKEQSSYAPLDGNHLVTTLDYDAQAAAAGFFEGKRGSVVALDPRTGEVLVLYSSPGFDGNRITKKIDKPYWQKINLDPDKYLFNRAIQAAYPPGSIYKIVTSIAGLTSGKVTPETVFSCGGGLRFGNRYFKCWNKGGHGAVALLRGIAQSCDVYFYNMGLKAGVDGLHQAALLFGLGQKTGIEIAYEQPGLIPSSEWKMKRYKQPWIDSETLSIAIGQGYDLVTPLQAARMISMVANGGRPLRPHLGKGVLDPARRLLKEFKVSPGAPVIPEKELKLVAQGVIDVVHGVGTATKLKVSPYKIAGKTGTAQVVGHDSGVRAAGRTLAHGWFVAYAPYDDPKIAVAVIVENGGSGSGAAAPVAMGVIDTYLGKIMPIKEENK
ncbi:MAG: penicillin-binding protein 2 [Deltaproteobacteria bacterium]|nr:penicillin-binding protein 2 [Deltaproteobacteria bacterium]